MCPTSRRETDTEAVYFEALKTIGRQLDLRVITDVVAGASAGGINGIFLARALAHDLPISNLRAMWLELADVTEFLAPEGKARTWSKFLLKPLIWAIIRARFRRLAPDREIREKLSTFLRSRWFHPPFEGASGALDVRSLKKQAFFAILDTEAAHLTDSAELFTSLRAEIDRI